MDHRREGWQDTAHCAGTAVQPATLPVIARGDRFYERYGPIAVLLTPSWIAGIHDMRLSRFLLANTVSALAWALFVGVGAYLVGPAITDIVADAGLAGTLLVGALVVLALLLTMKRRSSRRRAREPRDTDTG